MLQALFDLNLSPEVHQNPQPLKGYYDKLDDVRRPLKTAQAIAPYVL
ncbi:MAG: hypothetical protein V7L14_19345 [Nostoc sp.]